MRKITRSFKNFFKKLYFIVVVVVVTVAWQQSDLNLKHESMLKPATINHRLML
jgi:hypothetical protein